MDETLCLLACKYAIMEIVLKGSVAFATRIDDKLYKIDLLSVVDYIDSKLEKIEGTGGAGNAENDYISREAASNVITELLSSPWATEGTHSIGIKEALSLVRDMIRGNVPKGMQIPAADVRPVVRGEWERKPDPYGFFGTIPVCSNCGCTTKLREEYAFCPHCGADMRGEGE